MFDILQVVTVLLVAVAMALTLAHALDLPGKMRLTKDVYYAMQHIYYPGFTIGGFAEPASLILTIILLFFTPLGSADFCLTLVALLGLIGMQATYWMFTHPVNKYWVQGQKLSGLGSGFFLIGCQSLTAAEQKPRGGLDGFTQSLGIFTRGTRRPRIRKSNIACHRHLECR